MLLPIGAIVHCHDGAAGRLKYVVLDPDDGEVTHLIVERGMLLHRDIVVPVSWIERTTEATLYLNANRDDLKVLPEYDEREFVMPDPAYRPLSGHRVEDTRVWLGPYAVVGGGRPWVLQRVRLGVEDDEVLIRRGLPVLTSDDRPAGVIDHLVVDPTSKHITHLVVRRGWLWNRQARLVPVDQVAAVSEYGVRLRLSAAGLDHLPPYQPPASDAQITAWLQRSLATDARTRDAQLTVTVEDGVVRIGGAPTAEVAAAARAIARRLRGVIGVEDEPAPPPPAPPLRIGAPVYARDGRYGTLDKVVADPYTRRVTHLIVRQGWLLTEDRVVPIERVARAEPNGIYLDGTAAELDAFPAYREERFVSPTEDWEALEPYALSDTLFWGEPYAGVAPPVLTALEHVVAVGVPEGEVVLRRGIDVFYDGGLVGSLDHLLFDPASGALTHLVVEVYGRDRRVIVPMEWVSEIHAGAIVLRRWNPYQPGVPPYTAARDDAAIFADLVARLHADPALRAVQVQVERGAARLTGVVPTESAKAEAERIARSIPGVVGVEVALEIRPPEQGALPAEATPH
jgi:osmotically-inducible protein OsmY